ncbi:MAG: hypothetical protein KGL43_19285, partial [Burkholderiales bacterium]|nr:hypothetical protein [Burkholderiales bacterium]
LASVVNNSGVIEARTVENRNGSIVLAGGAAAGRVEVGGTLDVSSANGSGGVVTATAQQVDLVDGALVNANGSSGGGTINIGSGWEGGGGIAPATTVTMAAGATLEASATAAGNGGQVTVRSDIHDPLGKTLAHGTIRAQGGPEGGNGGQIETSGYYLDVGGLGVSASAAKGAAGLWLLDPNNIDIVDTSSSSLTTSGGTASYTNSTTSTIAASTLVTALEAGNNVTITNSGPMGDITVDSPIVKTSGATDVTLTLQAIDTIIVNQPIGFTASSGNAGKLNVNLWADTDHDGAGIVILNNSITTGGGSLNFGTGATATVGGVANTMVGGDVFVGGSSAVNLTTTGGAVAFNGQLIIANPAGLNIDSITGSASGGNVTFSGLVDSGNSYSLNSSVTSWTNAFAQNKSGSGANVGDTYLGTINSRLENAVASYTAQYTGVWLGAQRVIGIGTDNVWRWVGGSDGLMNGGLGLPFFTQNASGGGGSAINGAYTNWNSGEPNNYNGSGLSTPPTTAGAGENSMQFTGTAGQWNDLNPYTQILPSVVEKNLAASSLMVNAGSGTSAGNVTFAGAIGGVKVLNNLALTGNVINLNANPVINTSGTQTYTGQVTAGGVPKNIVTVAAPNTTLAYGSTVPAYATSCSGLDCQYLTSNGTVTVSQAVGAVGLYGLTASGAVSSNPVDLIVYNAGSLLVNPLAINVIGTLVATRADDGTTTATLSGGSLSGALSGDLANLTLAQSGAFASKNAGTNMPVVVSDTLGGSAAGNYTLLQPTDVTGTITRASLGVGGSTTVSGKLYDGTTLAALSGGTLSGTIYGGDTPTLVQAGSFATKNVGSAIAVTPADSLSGTGAGNYALTQPSGSYSATITAAPLTVTAGAVSKTYDGGFGTNGAAPTLGALAGAAAGETLGSSGIETFADKNVGSGKTVYASGLTVLDSSLHDVTSNYAITYVASTAGRITLAPLTVTATTVVKTYDGTLGTNGALPLVGALAGAGAGETLGNAGTETFADRNAGSAKTVSAAGVTVLDSSQADVTSNYAITYVADHASRIAQAPLTVTAIAVSKTYDGTVGTNGALPVIGALAGAAAGDVLGSRGSETFADKSAGSGKTVHAAGVTVLDSALADVTSNYAISYVADSASRIAQAPLAVTAIAVSKTYDGTVGTNGALPLIGSLAGAAAGDVLGSSGSETFADKNVGTSKPVSASGVTIKDAGGADVTSNYAISYASNPGGSISRLASVTWVGGATGNWFDPANWAGGAVPDLSNVANVVIPSGVVVSFSNSLVAPAQAGAVNLDSLGTAGSLAMAAGTLNVGSGGVALAGLDQSGGALTSIGPIALGSLSQSGGALATSGNFSTSTQFTQSGAGTLAVGGDASIGATRGDVQLGNLASTGPLSVTDTGGSIGQATGTVLNAGAASSFTASNGASAANVVLTNPGDSFAGPVSISGTNATLAVDGPLSLGSVATSGNLTLNSNGALDLGNSSVGGNLMASSGNGNVTQDGALAVGGTTSIDAGSGTITLANAGNTLAQPVSLAGANASLTTAGPLTLGSVA